jgi:membrane-bound metal-dependent hydrolase YbcI (DUF457 family)
MASPIGHALAGQIAYRAGSAATKARARTLAWLCVFAAVSPDLDFIPGLWGGHPALYHQGASHSLIAAAGFSLLLAIVYVRGRGGLFAAWAPLFLAYASHLGLDLLGPDRRPPYGIPLFWPFSQATYLSPLTIFAGFHHAGSTGAGVGQWISGILDVRNLAALLLEIAILGPILLLVELWVRRRDRTARSAGGGPSGG